MITSYDPNQVNGGTEQLVNLTVATVYDGIPCSRTFAITVTGNARGLACVEIAIDRIIENAQDNQRLNFVF